MRAVTVAGRRDYAILLLLVTYGLRGREVAALTLDDIDDIGPRPQMEAPSAWQWQAGEAR